MSVACQLLHSVVVVVICVIGTGFGYNEEKCRNAGGFCASTSQCPGKNYVSYKCPTQPSNIKCCLSLLYQERQCSSAGGSCEDETSCGRKGLRTVSGKCPTQPTGIKCCLESPQTSQIDFEELGLGDTTEFIEKVKLDVENLKKYDASFKTAGTKYGLPESVLKAIASRESGAGRFLGKWGNKPGWGDHNNGFGIMQVDKRHHAIHESSIDNVDQGASILKEFHKAVKRKHSDWSEAWQLRGAVAAYNFGIKNVQTQSGIDVGSAGGNYSRDVMARAQYLENL